MAALQAIRNVGNLPMPQIPMGTARQNDDSVEPVGRVRFISDILEWLSSIFGFQVNDM